MCQVAWKCLLAKLYKECQASMIILKFKKRDHKQYRYCRGI